MSMIGKLLKKELQEILPIFMFFFVADLLLLITKALILKSYGIEIFSFAIIFFEALIFTKVILIIDKLKITNLFDKNPLIYKICWDTTVYTFFALLLLYLEKVLPKWWSKADFIIANQLVWNAIVWPQFFAELIWGILLFITFIVQREFIRMIGKKRLYEIFFK